MDGREFHRRIVEDDRFDWQGVREGATAEDDEVFVKHTSTGSRFAISISAIREHDWEELEAVITGQRTPRIMAHITRIVGYYSQLQNWNKSKIAELRDRQRGNYALPGAWREGDGSGKARQEAEAREAPVGV